LTPSLVVSQAFMLSVLLFGALCVVSAAIALTIVAGGRASVPVSRFLHNQDS
jgi:hypothetical protein